MKKINNFLKEYSNNIIIACFIIMFIILLGVTITTLINADKQQQDYVVYDVIAATDETYILQECDNKKHYIEVDQSEMYGVGETVICTYADGQITSIWLYVDC